MQLTPKTVAAALKGDASRHLPRDLPERMSITLRVTPHMWETSKRDVWDRQCAVASMMVSLYWIGMDHPAKGTILPAESVIENFRSDISALMRDSCRSEYSASMHQHRLKL